MAESDQILRALEPGRRVVAAELRPPRAELGTEAGMDAWIDTYHTVRDLVRHGTFVFLTDNAVGLHEEDNIRHLVTNMGEDVPRSRVVPFLTCKHTLDHCLAYSERAWQHGFCSLVVLGGDRTLGPPRCVEHAWQLRQQIRQRQPGLRLGGWANPYAGAVEQVEFLRRPEATVEFFLTQVVSHHTLGPVSLFLEESRRRNLAQPGIFGVFFYRSANPRTLELVSRFLPVPSEALTREFASGASPEQVCARTLRALADLGAQHFYLSNLPLARAHQTLAVILDYAGF